jgi:hypothetical protein
MNRFRKAPVINCPACHYVRQRVIDGEWTVICGIILKDELAGKETFPNFEIVPEHCMNYTKCQIWRDSKDKHWRTQVGKRYSSLGQAEKIRVNG